MHAWIDLHVCGGMHVWLCTSYNQAWVWRQQLHYYYINMLRCKPSFFSKTLVFKNSETLLHTLKLSLISLEIFYKSKQKLHFHDQKELKFFDQNLQSVAILHAKLKIFSFIFFNLVLFSNYFPMSYSSRLWLFSNTKFF